MALKLVLTETAIGAEFGEAYARVGSVNLDKDSALVSVSVHASAAARQSGARPIEQRNHSFSTSALKGDILPAVYAVLKKLPEYAGAEDC